MKLKPLNEQPEFRCAESKHFPPVTAIVRNVRHAYGEIQFTFGRCQNISIKAESLPEWLKDGEAVKIDIASGTLALADENTKARLLEYQQIDPFIENQHGI